MVSHTMDQFLSKQTDIFLEQSSWKRFSAEKPCRALHVNLETSVFHVFKMLVNEGMLVREENKEFS